MFKYIWIVLILLVAVGCSTRYAKQTNHPTLNHPKNNHPRQIQSKTNVSTILSQQYNRWKNTPYRYAGQDPYGVDCSSFIQQVYRDGFGIKLPRSTIKQVKKGYFVSRHNIKEGDMVFFKTGYNTRHTGVMMQNSNFIHVSTSKGVTISNLNNPYWNDRYWQTRRVIR